MTTDERGKLSVPCLRDRATAVRRCLVGARRLKKCNGSCRSPAGYKHKTIFCTQLQKGGCFWAGKEPASTPHMCVWKLTPGLLSHTPSPNPSDRLWRIDISLMLLGARSCLTFCFHRLAPPIIPPPSPARVIIYIECYLLHLFRPTGPAHRTGRSTALRRTTEESTSDPDGRGCHDVPCNWCTADFIEVSVER